MTLQCRSQGKHRFLSRMDFLISCRQRMRTMQYAPLSTGCHGRDEQEQREEKKFKYRNQLSKDNKTFIGFKVKL